MIDPLPSSAFDDLTRGLPPIPWYAVKSSSVEGRKQGDLMRGKWI